MNLLSFFRPKPPEPLPHVRIRYVAATERENKEAKRRRQELEAKLRSEVGTIEKDAQDAARERAKRAGRARG